MRCVVTIGDRTFEVDLSGDVPLVDGRPVSVDVARVPGTALRHLLMDGRSVRVVPGEGGAGRWTLRVGGSRLSAVVEDERARRLAAMRRGPAAPESLRPLVAPMPGLVVRVMVEPGQAVEAGQPLVAIEAMKMQNELAAAGAGVVARVAVAPGQAVGRGATLVEFE